MSDRVRRVLAVVAVAWAVVAALSAASAARRTPVDPMARLEAEFLPLAAALPVRGEIGYLERYENGGAEDAVRTHYAAQYALTPRVVRARTGQEFVVVAAGHDRPGGDPRLRGYAPVASSPAGHRVFRRFPQ